MLSMHCARFYTLKNIKFTRYGIKQCRLTGNKRRHSLAILLQGRDTRNTHITRFEDLRTTGLRQKSTFSVSLPHFPSIYWSFLIG